MSIRILRRLLCCQREATDEQIKFFEILVLLLVYDLDGFLFLTYSKLQIGTKEQSITVIEAIKRVDSNRCQTILFLLSQNLYLRLILYSGHICRDSSTHGRKSICGSVWPTLVFKFHYTPTNVPFNHATVFLNTRQVEKEKKTAKTETTLKSPLSCIHNNLRRNRVKVSQN